MWSSRAARLRGSRGAAEHRQAGPVEAPWRSRRESREALPGPGGRCGNVRCDGLCVARGGLQGSGDVLGGVLGFYWKTLKFGAIQHSKRCYSFT